MDQTHLRRVLDGITDEMGLHPLFSGLMWVAPNDGGRWTAEQRANWLRLAEAIVDCVAVVADSAEDQADKTAEALAQRDMELAEARVLIAALEANTTLAEREREKREEFMSKQTAELTRLDAVVADLQEKLMHPPIVVVMPEPEVEPDIEPPEAEQLSRGRSETLPDAVPLDAETLPETLPEALPDPDAEPEVTTFVPTKRQSPPPTMTRDKGASGHLEPTDSDIHKRYLGLRTNGVSDAAARDQVAKRYDLLPAEIDTAIERAQKPKGSWVTDKPLCLERGGRGLPCIEERGHMTDHIDANGAKWKQKATKPVTEPELVKAAAAVAGEPEAADALLLDRTLATVPCKVDGCNHRAPQLGSWARICNTHKAAVKAGGTLEIEAAEYEVAPSGRGIRRVQVTA